MGEANWGPLLLDGSHAVTVYLEADLTVIDDQYQPNAVGIGTVGSLLVSPDAVWTDLTERIMTCTVDGGFDRATQTFQGWTLDATLRNDDGALSRNNSNSPYYLAGIGSTIRASMPVRLRATYDNGSTVRDWTLFTGSMDSWDPVYDAAGFDPKIKVKATDDTAKLAGFDGFEQTPVGGGETTGARMNRVLDNAGHTGVRSIDTGKHTVQATTLAQNALAELKLTADSEGGWLYIDPSGRLIFEDRDAMVTRDRSREVQITFADDGRVDCLHYLLPVQPRYDKGLLVTDAAYARTGGTMQHHASTNARSRYRQIAQRTRTDLACETDDQALYLAKRTVGLQTEVRERIDTLEFAPDGQMVNGAVDPTLQAAAWDAISSQRLCLLALTNIVHTPVQPVGAPIDPYDQLEFIQSIRHEITSSDWRVGLSFASAELWAAVQNSRVGFGRVGELVVWI